MNILLINHYAGSLHLGMEFRPYYLAKNWSELGHKTTIIGATYSHLRHHQPKQAGWDNIDGIEYLWLWTNQYHDNGLKRLLTMLIFVIQLMLISFYLAWKTKPQMVIASSTYPLDIFPAWLIAKLSRAKLVFEIHDLWPLSPMELGGMGKWHPFIMLMRCGEWFAYRTSNKIISILPGTYEHVKKDGVKKENFVYIPNGISVDDYKNPLPTSKNIQQLIEREKKKKNIIIGYAGAVGIANALAILIEAAHLLKKEKLSFIIAGDGQELANIKARVRELKLDNIHFVGRINKLTVHNFLQHMDFLYFGTQDKSIYRFGVSLNKMFDYMMAGKPIIQSINTNYDIIREAKCGFTTVPGNADALADLIKATLRTSKKTLSLMGKNGQEYALKNHTYNFIAKKFIENIAG